MIPKPTGRLDNNDLVLTRTFRAPIEDVWTSVTSSESTARWFGPWERVPGGDDKKIRVQMAFEEGKPYRLTLKNAADGEHTFTATEFFRSVGLRADAAGQQEQVLDRPREHALRLPGFEEHYRAEALAVRIVGRQSMQPERQADRDQTGEKQRCEEAHVVPACLRFCGSLARLTQTGGRWLRHPRAPKRRAAELALAHLFA